MPDRFSAIRLGVVCPMANEEATAAEFVAEVLRNVQPFGFAEVAFFAVLDNVSRDRTRELLMELAERHPEVRVVWAPENRAVADAYVRGYREALEHGADWILEIDAGFSHNPAEIPNLLRAMGDDTQCVFGTRFATGGENRGPKRRRAISYGGTILSRVLLGTRLSDMTSGFELFRRDALEEVLRRGIRSKGPFFQTEIKVYCRRMQVVEVPITYDAATHRVRASALWESLVNLSYLVRMRMSGRLT